MTIFMIICIECLRSQRLLVKRMLELKMAVTPTSVRCSDSHLCCPISNISTTPTKLLCISSNTTSSSTSSTTTSQPPPLHCSVFRFKHFVHFAQLNQPQCTLLNSTEPHSKSTYFQCVPLRSTSHSSV